VGFLGLAPKVSPVFNQCRTGGAKPKDPLYPLPISGQSGVSGWEQPTAHWRVIGQCNGSACYDHKSVYTNYGGREIVDSPERRASFKPLNWG